MPRKTKPDPLPTHRCDGTWPDPENPRQEIRCSQEVQPRRPSTSGRHFCTNSKCQTAKQRFYRQLRAQEVAVKDDELGDLFADFLEAVLYAPRTNCGYCNAQNVLPGWAHRAEVGGRPCRMLGPRGPGLPPRALDIAFPDRAPGAATLDSSG